MNRVEFEKGVRLWYFKCTYSLFELNGSNVGQWLQFEAY